MVTQEIILTKEECNEIIGKVHNSWFKRSRVSNEDDLSEVSDIRTSYEFTFDKSNFLNNLLLPKLKKYGVVSLPSFIKLIRYEKGQEFGYHVDNGGVFNYRKKSVSIQLSDEYDGGDMNIWGYEGDVFFDKSVGNMVIFDSSLPHQIFPIKSGTRYALVFWLSEENLI